MNKNALRTLCGLTLLSLALYAPSVLADPAPQKKTTTTAAPTLNSSGIVSEFSPDTDKIVIRTATSVKPITYQSTASTTYVDDAGNPVEHETVKSGAPVTIYYSMSGDKMVATKVVVKETAPQPRG